MIQIFKLVLLLVVSQVAFGQAPSNYTNINGRYRWIAGMFDSTFHIPKGTTNSLRVGGSTNAGALFFNTTDSTVYTYTGTQWIKLRGVVIDTTSLSNRINLKLNISDTAAMLAPYLRKVDTASLSNRINLKLNISDTATMLGNYLNNVGYGLIRSGQVVRADSATLASYFLRRKDSLTTTNPLGYVTRTILADTAAAIRSSATSGFVPYTGATQNVNLGQFGLTTKFVQFDTSSQAVTDRRLQWSNDEGTLQFGMTNGATITQRIGLEQFARVKNVDATQINKGEAVYIFGASGDRASVKKADNRQDATSSKTLGVAAEDIPVNDVGLVGTFGVVSNLNLNAYTAGDILYLDSIPGGLTKNKPQAPYHLVFIGVVERANSGNGLLFVNPQNGYELEELHNVRITSPVRNNALLVYDSTRSLWIDTTIAQAGLAVTQVNTNSGSGITGGPITTVGTIAADTLVLSTRAWRQKGIDSVQGNLTAGLALKLNISDTANMLLPYLRKVDTASLSNRINTKLNISDTATMLGNYVNNVGYGLSKVSQVVSADSATLASYFLRRKDSLTATNLLGYVTGKILADTAAAVRAAAGAGTIGGSGTTNRVSKFTASGTIGNSSIVDSSSSVAMSISSAGNIGVGITPSNWATNYKAFQFNNTSLATFTGLNEQANLALNWYADSGGDKYYANGASSLYQQSNGNHFFYTAPTGTANNSITFSQRFGVYNDGKVAVGLTSSDSLFSVTQGVHLQRGVRLSGLPTAPGTRALRIDANGTLSIADTTTGGIGGSGTINRLAKFTASGTIGNSSIADSSSSVRMTILSGGNIGIGTTAPDANLHLYANTTNDLQFKIENVGIGDAGIGIYAGTGKRVFQRYYVGTAAKWGLFINDATIGTDSYGLYNYSTSSFALSLTSGGNLGVGTNTIGSKLQVNGNAAIGYSASTAAPTNGLQVAGDILQNVNSTTFQTAGRNVIVSNGTSSALIGLMTGGTNRGYFFHDGTDAYLYNVSNGATIFGSNNLERGRFLAGGGLIIGNGETAGTPTLGIISATGGTGTNVAGAEFRIRGGASTGSGAGGPITFYTSAAGTAGTSTNAATERMRLDASGNLGLGTNSPVGRLDVFRASTNTTAFNEPQQRLVNSGTATANQRVDLMMRWEDGTYNGSGGISMVRESSTARNGALVFSSINSSGNATEALRLNAGGNVGIGTATIGSTLQVNGNAAIGYSASTAAPTNGLAVSGSVGIGTNTAQSLLTVRGTPNTDYGLVNLVDTRTAAIDQGPSVAFGGFITGTSTGATFGLIGARKENATSGNEAGYIGFYPNNGSGVYTERMRITSGGQVTLSTGSNVSAIAQTGYSLTGSNASSLIDLAGTWNTTGNPTAIKLNITNTASGATANLMDLQVGGTSEFKVTKAGYVGINQGTPTSMLHTQGSVATAYSSKTATYTLTGDDHTVLFNAVGAAANLTANLPDATTCTGRIYVIIGVVGGSTTNVTIDGNGTQTIGGSQTYTFWNACETYGTLIIQSDGSNWQILSQYIESSGC